MSLWLAGSSNYLGKVTTKRARLQKCNARLQNMTPNVVQARLDIRRGLEISHISSEHQREKLLASSPF